MTKLYNFLRDENGATAIEYGLIAACISVAIIAAITSVGSKLNTTFYERFERALTASRKSKLFGSGHWPEPFLSQNLVVSGDRGIAELINSMQVDIVVDRSGYTTNARPGVFASRPAPIQVNYLGYPGTLGTDFFDYVIADVTVLPFDQQKFYSEKIVHLPDCYQSNDSQRTIAASSMTREQAGLPPQGFVFCCFNNPAKIRAQIFDVWMRLLHQVPQSTLWLLDGGEAAAANVSREATSRGIDPKRVVFAPWSEPGAHLARHRLADLFLDTLPFNAHTTASDALWAGLL